MGGTDSKLKYQQAFYTLIEKPLPDSTSSSTSSSGTAAASTTFGDFFSVFWTLPTSPEDVFTLLKMEDIRELREKQPNNFYILIRKILKEMKRIINGCYNNQPPKDFNSLLNCIRLFTRLLPLIFENGPTSEFVENLLWQNKKMVTPKSEEFTKVEVENKSMEGEDAPIEEIALHPTAASPSTPAPVPASHPSEEEEEEVETEPFALRLLDTLLHLLFLPNFTISSSKAKSVVGDKGPQFLPLDYVWAPGIGVKQVLPTTSQMLSNRTELLKCLLACFSETLFISPEQLPFYQNRWVDHVSCRSSTHSLVLFYSLLNTVCSYDPIGWGVPYNHVFLSDLNEALVSVALQVLSVLLHHTPCLPVDSASLDEEDHSENSPPSNVFIEYLKDLGGPKDFQLLFSAFTRLLNNPLSANSTYLPNSSKPISFHQEVLMFLWKSIQENQSFLFYILRKEDIIQILVPILYYLHEGRKDSSQLGLIHLGTFIILFLSGEREFSVALNKPFTHKLIIDLPVFHGNYADYLLLIFIKLLTDGHEKLDSLYECLLTILTNLSPYIKSLAMITSIRLMKLFDRLSKPKFLFNNERNCRYIFFVLEAFNNIVQYQYEGNSRLIYSMIRHRESFTKLANLQLPTNERGREEEKKTEGVQTEDEVEQKRSEKEDGEDNVRDEEEEKEKSGEGETVGEEGRKETEETDHLIKEPKITTEKATVSVPRGSETPRSTFTPTQEWLQAWKQQLPLATIMRLLGAIVPQLPSLCTGSSSDESQILTYLQNSTMVGILPVPHPILIRRYHQNEATNQWFTKYLWGVIYLRNQLPPIFYGSQLRLFIVNILD